MIADPTFPPFAPIPFISALSLSPVKVLHSATDPLKNKFASIDLK